MRVESMLILELKGLHEAISWSADTWIEPISGPYVDEKRHLRIECMRAVRGKFSISDGCVENIETYAIEDILSLISACDRLIYSESEYVGLCDGYLACEVLRRNSKILLKIESNDDAFHYEFEFSEVEFVGRLHLARINIVKFIEIYAIGAFWRDVMRETITRRAEF